MASSPEPTTAAGVGRAENRPGRIRASSVARALTMVGDRWSLLILGGAFLGMRRFGEWQERLGIASNILSDRLRRLVAAGCLAKERAAEDGRRFEYRLTRMGRELYPTALMFWRFDHLWSRGRHPVAARLIHRACGVVMEPLLVCHHCRREVVAGDVRYEDGPGCGYEALPPPRLSRRPSGSDGRMARAPSLFGESVDYLGDRWTQLVLASLFMGAHRFDEIRTDWKMASNILADRLRSLSAAGLIEQRRYQRRPERYEYVLTRKGRDIYPIIVTLARWGDDWLADDAGVPMIFHHRPCGRVLDARVVCAHCGLKPQPRDVSLEPSA